MRMNKMGRNTILGIGLTLIYAGWQILGVLLLDWPLGNLFVLMWFENVILTLLAIGRMLAYRDTEGFAWGNLLNTGFGMLFFCAIHGVFSVILAFGVGVDASAAMLYLPAALIVVRCLVELRERSRPAEFKDTYGFAMSRIIMLHFVIIACWIITLASRSYALNGEPPIDVRLIVLILLVAIKTVVEVISQIPWKHPLPTFEVTTGKR